MPDSVLAFYFIALCALTALWFLSYRAIFRRLQERHPAKFSTLFGTPERRKNGMDRSFALIGFLFQDQSALRDVRLLVTCILLKLVSVLFLVTFVAMMFTPFFLKLRH